MTEYITAAQVDALLGDAWTTADKKDRAVLMANVWLAERLSVTFANVPDQVVQAGAEIAREAASGALYGASETGVLSKSVEAGGVSSSKTFSATARTVTAGESFAMALLAPYLSAGQVRLVRG